MKIVLVNPPILDRRSIEIPTRAHNPFEHMGLCYIGSVLREKGHDVKIIDSYINNRTIEETLNLIEKESPKLVGFSATHEFLTAAVDLSRKLRDKGYHGHITMGGYLPTFLHDKIMNEYPYFDSIVRGEGELTIIELVEKLEEKSKWHTIAGLTWRDKDGVHINPPRDLIPDLNTLPFPIRDTLPDLQKMYDYSAMSSSRGCPMNCSFCSIRAFYRRSKGAVWRARSPKNVVDEMEILVAKHKVLQIAFTDDNFIGIPKIGRIRAFSIAKEILKRGLKVEFSLLLRVDTLDEGLLKFLKLAGLRSLFVGFESGVDRALLTFNKKITAEQNRKAIDLIKKVGIKCFPGFIMFDPYTTMEEVKENLRFVEYAEKDTDLIKIDDLLGSLQPFTGTPIRERLEKEGRIIYPESPLLKWDVIPSYEIENPDVETLRRAAKNIRRQLKRPLFDQFNLICRKLTPQEWKQFQPTYKKFQSLVQKMRDFEKAFFRECIKFIEKNPNIKPHESYKAEALVENDVKKFNKEVNKINDEILKWWNKLQINHNP